MRSRHVASHELNQDSSRSHSMTTLHVWTAAPGAGGGGQGPGGGPGGVSGGARRMGKVTFVDLAGSERLKQSRTADGKETGSINRSLFALGKVIAALADNAAAGGGAAAHIPYRDSALTKLLTDSLGGSSLALMIACCSPSLRHLEETLSTLNYATRAKNIQNRPAVKMDAQQQLVACLRQEIDMLRSENAYFRQQLGIGVNSRPLSSSHPAAAAMPTSAPSRLHSGPPRGTSPRSRGEPRHGPAGGRLAPLSAGEGVAGARRGRSSPPSSSHDQLREPRGARGGQAAGRGSSRLGHGTGGHGLPSWGGAGGEEGSPQRGPSAEDFERMVQKNQELTVAKSLLELELRDAGAENARLEAKLEHLETVFTSSSQAGDLLLHDEPTLGRGGEERGEHAPPARAPALSLATPMAGSPDNRGLAEGPRAAVGLEPGPGPGPEPGPAPRGVRRPLLLMTGGALAEEKPVLAAGGLDPRPPGEPRSNRARSGGRPPPEGTAAAPPDDKPRAAPGCSPAGPQRKSPACSPASVGSGSPPAVARGGAGGGGGGGSGGGGGGGPALGGPASLAGGVIKVSQGMRALLGLG